jgi:UDPglucose 6-dehydrogenase
MKIAVIGGLGYVGLVSGACLADLGNDVICTGLEPDRIEMLKQAKSPIYEPGIEDVLARNIDEGRLSFTTDNAAAVHASDVIFITVGTPSAADGSADLSYVKQAVTEIATAMQSDRDQRYRVIVNKSTVPIGTGAQVTTWIKEIYAGAFDVVSNPEFLREGVAVSDFSQPDRVVIGSESERAKVVMDELYGPLKAPIVHTDIKTAEMVKYASNAYLATSISFINALSELCDAVGADVTKVAEGMRYDDRIGKRAFLDAGIGYGGSCFPKDVKALIHIGHEYQVPLTILEAVESVNERQKTMIIKKVEELDLDLAGKKVAIWGLAFKPNTDDMREAPSISVVAALQERGAEIVAFDPVAEATARKVLKDIAYVERPLEAVADAHLLVIATEWSNFTSLDLEELKSAMAEPVIIDGRNIYDPHKMKQMGFTYRSIGRPE